MLVDAEVHQIYVANRVQWTTMSNMFALPETDWPLGFGLDPDLVGLLI